MKEAEFRDPLFQWIY